MKFPDTRSDSLSRIPLFLIAFVLANRVDVLQGTPNQIPKLLLLYYIDRLRPAMAHAAWTMAAHMMMES